MTDLRKAAQAVVERWDTPSWKDVPATAIYIEALRQALSQPEQEPVVGTKTWVEDGKVFTQNLYASDIYITPPKQWVGLTDGEREEATGWSVDHIEAFLKEKNT